MVKCADVDGNDTYFRCVLFEEELRKFCEALKGVSQEYDANDTVNILHHEEKSPGMIKSMLPLVCNG